MRKLATAAAVSLALASGGAFGLGLGDIEMRSALNQPMSAEIRLTSVKPGELDGMIVQLASADAFARAGIDRSQALTDLTFTVDQSSNVPVIRISSNRPVVEPFLNFLLEVDWPQGRMVREYTVLLDPPVFMTPSATERNTVADQPAVVQRSEEVLVSPTPIQRDTNVALADTFEVEVVDGSASAEVEDSAVVNIDDGGDVISLEGLDEIAAEGEIISLTDSGVPNTEAIETREAELAFDPDAFEIEVVGGDAEEVSDDFVIASEETTEDFVVEIDDSDLADSSDGSTIVSLEELEETVSTERATEVTVERGDTLFEIATANAQSGVSVEQMMMALLEANQSSFIQGNINLVKAGEILRIPDADAASTLTQGQALAAIGQQSQLWQEYRDNLRETQSTTLVENQNTDDNATADVTDASADSAVNQPAVTDAVTDSDATGNTDSDVTSDGLSAEAQAILDSARNEILNRDELKILADSSTTTSGASATSDDANSETSRLSEINRKLQLAREELSSTRIQTDDLSEQADELGATTDNLDALVTLRQNEVARLEAQLSDAREAAEAEAAAVADGATDIVADSDAAGDAVADLAGDAADAADSAVADVTATVTEAAGDAQEKLTEITSIATDTDADATTDADAASNAAVTTPEPVASTPWYQDFLKDPMKMLIAGIGALAALLLGFLLFRRKKSDPEELDVDGAPIIFDEQVDGDLDLPDDSIASAGDAVGSAAGKGVDAVKGAAGAAGAAGVAAAGAGAAAIGGVFGGDDDKVEDKIEDKFENADFAETASFSDTDDTMDFGSETQAISDFDEDGIDKDDTISEVDVYLAYGLHGQAEELLNKGIAAEPDNAEYRVKLLETYHAQGNGEGFHQAATDYQQRFGTANPEWEKISALGVELRPGDSLYSSAASTVESVGTGQVGGTALDETDFTSSNDVDMPTSSVSRDFTSADEAVDFDNGDESELMDQSIDPAFAFSEEDLESTGDFSKVASEISDDTGTIEFPDFSSDADSALDKVSDAGSDGLAAGAAAIGGAGAVIGGAAAAAGDSIGGLGDSIGDTLGGLGDESLNLDELDASNVADAANDSLDLSSLADDLTLDLDQLSTDMDLDSTELLGDGGAINDLEIPDLTADNDLLSGGDVAADSDEMDTMMDLAKAYIDMGDNDSASSALGEIVKSGSPQQVTEAETLLRKIS